jgi:hypothetical protein
VAAWASALSTIPSRNTGSFTIENSNHGTTTGCGPPFMANAEKRPDKLIPHASRIPADPIVLNMTPEMALHMRHHGSTPFDSQGPLTLSMARETLFKTFKNYLPAFLLSYRCGYGRCARGKISCYLRGEMLSRRLD